MRETAMLGHERASPDYERPDQDVADIKPPVVLPTNKARQAENRGHMAMVLTVGTGLAILMLAITYLLA
jgi:hypothetical protein